MGSSNGFWHTELGKSIRWILYLPVGLILMYLIENLTWHYCVWLNEASFKQLYIYSIVFGSFVTILPISILLYVGCLYLVNRIICPKPKSGIVIFTVFYLFFNGFVMYKAFFQVHSTERVILLIEKAMMLLVTLGFIYYTRKHLKQDSAKATYLDA